MANIIKGTPGIITSYRRGKHRIHPTQILCKFDDFDTDKAASTLIGHEIEWLSETGRSIRGKVTRVHGKKGVVRVKLHNKGVPGQAIGTKVTIIK